MAAIDIQGFAAAAEGVALRLDSARLPGLLRKVLTVPRGMVALVRDEDEREVVLKAGQEQGGAFTGALVREGEVAVPFQLGALPDKEGLVVTLGVEVVLRMPVHDFMIRAFVSTLLRDRDRADVADLRAYLLPAVRSALSVFVGARTAEELATHDLREELDAALREELKAACFPAGLDVASVRHPSVFCEAYERSRARENEARAQEAEIQRGERLQELRARLEKNEVLKKKEVDELAKVLQYEGVLKEISLKNDLDRRRRDEELRRFEALHQKLGHDDVKALIFLLDDERLKADLIRQLVERDMSEEQIRAKRTSDLEGKLESRLNELSQKLAELQGLKARRTAERGMRTRRVLGVFGKTAVAFDPGTNIRREAPKEVYDLERGELGYLRSVRVAATRDGPAVLAGAQRGVYLVRAGVAHDVRELRFPREPGGQGGVNATAYFDGHVYATHSELGLYRWDQYLGVAEPLYGAVTARHDSTRGVMVLPDGKLFFASGPDIFRADLVRPEAELIAYRGREEPITTFLATRDEVFAGTRGGRVVRWSLSDPGSPRELNVRKAEPIYMLKIAEVGGEDHVLLGAKDHGVTAVSLATGRAVDYRARDQIRWVDGASDFVYGVSRSGYSIHVWEAGRLDQEAFELRVPDRLQDIFVDKERIEAASAVA